MSSLSLLVKTQVFTHYHALAQAFMLFSEVEVISHVSFQGVSQDFPKGTKGLRRGNFALRLSLNLSFQAEAYEEGQMLSLTKILCYHKSELKYILNIINKKVSKNEMILIKLLEFDRGLDVYYIRSGSSIKLQPRGHRYQLAWCLSRWEFLTTSSLVLADFSDSPSTNSSGLAKVSKILVKPMGPQSSKSR